jgi:hypothetical protein
MYALPELMAGGNPTPATGTMTTLRRSEIAMLIAVVLGCIGTLGFAAALIPQSFELNFEEGNDLYAALRILHGQTPYPPVGGLPYVINPYGPVFYYSLAPVVKPFGASFIAPRLFVLASGIAVVFLLVFLLKRWTGSWLVALSFGLLFLAMPLARNWVWVLRVDLFGLALTLGGLCVFTSSRRTMWPALLFLAALFAKITLLAAPIACWLYLLLSGERRRAWSLAGWMTAFGLAGVGALAYATHGWALFHMFRTHTDPYSVVHYLATIGPVALVNIVLLVAVAALAVRDFRIHTFSLPLIYFALATLATATAGKLGSDPNHLLEWQAAMCLAGGCGYQAFRSHARPEPALALIPIGLALLALIAIPHHWRPSPDFAGCPAAYRFAGTAPGEVLAENAGAAVVSGKKVWLSSSFEYAFLGKAGRLNQEPLIRLVQERFFGLILLGSNFAELEKAAAHPKAPLTIWPPGFVAALAANYHQAGHFACLNAAYAFEPRPVKNGTRPAP